MRKSCVLRNLGCGVMALLLLLTMSMSAFAMVPSVQLEQKQEQEEEELISDYKAVDEDGNEVGCIVLEAKPIGDIHSKKDAVDTPHIDTFDACYIKVTPLLQAETANATARLLDMTEEELRALVTATGVGFEKNEALVELALLLKELREIPAFIEKTGEGALEAVQAFLNEHMTDDAAKVLTNYDVAEIFDITANKKALEEHKDDVYLEIVMKLSGIKEGQPMFLQHIEADGTVEFIEAVCEKDGQLTFKYILGHDGPYILYVLAE